MTIDAGSPVSQIHGKVQNLSFRIDGSPMYLVSYWKDDKQETVWLYEGVEFQVDDDKDRVTLEVPW
ncbi:MAG TPA: hypothetical protein VGE52_04965 [Pirellulales bacterium]